MICFLINIYKVINLIKNFGKIMPTAEANTRVIIDSILINKGWILDAKNTNRNVYLEGDILNVITGEPYEKLKNSGKRPDYVLMDNDKKPIAIIEAKAGGKDLEKALDQGTNYAELLNAPLIFAMNNSYCQTRHLTEKKPLFINEQEVNELIRTKEAIKFITDNSNEIYTISKEILLSRQELIIFFKNINNSLRSEGLRAGIERLTEFANILFLKLYTENNNENIWNNLKNTPNDCLIDMVNVSLKNIQTEYKTDILSDVIIRNPDTMREIITGLDKLKLSSIDTDIKGDAFEYFLKQATATGNGLGEYFTPRHIVKTIINLINPKFGETIYDPFCGTGGFLTEAFNYIKDNTIIETIEDKTKLTHETIFGREITNNARLAKMNMILHGDGHNGIEQTDSLANPITNKYNVIATNMPFSQKIVKEIYDPETKKTIKKTLYSDLYLNGFAKNNGDGVCMLHCFEALKPGGRMALIVPEGVLFKQELKNVRKFLMDSCKLESVISLPQGIFLPYTGVKTDILYFVNCKQQSTEKVWFFDVQNDGFTLNNQRKKIKDNDLKKIDYIDFKKTDLEELTDLGFIQVDYEDIKKNDYNLSVNRYKEEKKICSNWEMVELGEVCELYQPKTITSNEILKNGKYKVYGANGVIGFYNNYNHEFSEVALTCRGATCGSVNFTEPESWITGNAMIVKPKNKNQFNKKFLFYLLKNTKLNNTISGAAQPQITRQNLTVFKIPLPPLEIQERVVKEIEEYEKIINGCKQIVDNWKLKFEIKEEWKLVELNTLVENTSGLWEGKKEPFIEVNVLRNTNFTMSGIINYSNVAKLQVEEKQFLNKQLQYGDIILERSGGSKDQPVGRVVFFDKKDNNYSYSNFTSKLRVINNSINNKYLFYILLFFYKIGLTEQYQTYTGGIRNLQLKDYLNIQIPIPSLDEQQEIVAKIEEEQKYVDGCKKMIEIYQEKVKKAIDGIVGKA